MRSIGRTLMRPGLARDITLVCVADALVGVSFGAIAVGLGLPLWLPVLLSLVVFAGAAQFLFVGIVGAGGNPVAAVAAGLLVNARHLPFGFAVGDVLATGWLRRLAGSHLMVDETVAFTLAQDDPRRRRIAYWGCGAGLFAAWNLGVLAGAFGGRAVGDTDAFGLDAAFPAVLVALLLPSLGDRAPRRAAGVGAAVALTATPWLPAGVPVLLALAGLAVAR
ncbi:AzlC family ABC transporter permease [Actinacidiphila rubida]|nr:AzlC family ABC transporter permease [Actinacidiphila rubida]